MRGLSISLTWDQDDLSILNDRALAEVQTTALRAIAVELGSRSRKNNKLSGSLFIPSGCLSFQVHYVVQEVL